MRGKEQSSACAQPIASEEHTLHEELRMLAAHRDELQASQAALQKKVAQMQAALEEAEAKCVHLDAKLADSQRDLSPSSAGATR